jgi:hypothetical protein
MVRRTCCNCSGPVRVRRAVRQQGQVRIGQQADADPAATGTPRAVGENEQLCSAMRILCDGAKQHRFFLAHWARLAPRLGHPDAPFNRRIRCHIRRS